MNRILSCSIFLVCLIAADRALHAFAPVDPSTVGHRQSANGSFYGWGYDPGEEIRLRDPDSGEVFVDTINNHGWRDRDRSYHNSPGTFRILALGDSNTFGVLVPAEETWTQLLERQLQRDGWDTEVLNIAYAGWGTDQELEALRREGVRYSPSMLILQFAINDLADIMEVVRGDRTLKPFYYTLTSDGRLERHDNPAFDRARAKEWVHPTRWLKTRSEIFKRLYIAWSNIQFSTRPLYFVRPEQFAQLQTVLSLPANDPFLKEMTNYVGDSIDSAAVDAILERTDRQGDREIVRRILENHPFKQAWMTFQYRPTPPDLESEEWRLLLRLIEEIKSTADSLGIPMAMISDQEEGLYHWERYWLRLAPGEQVHRNFLAPTAVLRRFCVEHGIGFIESRRKHSRARNDSHPNREGTRAMADNVVAYLREHDPRAIKAEEASGDGGRATEPR